MFAWCLLVHNLLPASLSSNHNTLHIIRPPSSAPSMMMNWLRAQSISNCRRVLLKVQHNNLTPTPIRSIQHPTAPHIVGVKRPERPKFFDEDGSLHYEIAVPEDHDFLLEWELVHAFYPRFAPIPTIGELKREEAIDFCSSSVKRGVNSGCSILGFDGNELVVMCLNSVVKMPDNGYTPLSDKDFPYNKLKQDYQAEIDAGPYKSPKANAIAALLEALAKDIHLAFPPGVKVIDVGRPNVVHKDHRRHGYALEALLLSVKMGRDLLDCYGTMSRMAVGKSTPLGQKLKDAEPEAAKIFRLIRFPQFLAGGKPVFQDSTEAFFIFGAYKDIKNIV